jgi:hypothetical protein
MSAPCESGYGISTPFQDRALRLKDKSPTSRRNRTNRSPSEQFCPTSAIGKLFRRLRFLAAGSCLVPKTWERRWSYCGADRAQLCWSLATFASDSARGVGGVMHNPGTRGASLPLLGRTHPAGRIRCVGGASACSFRNAYNSVRMGVLEEMCLASVWVLTAKCSTPVSRF